MTKSVELGLRVPALVRGRVKHARLSPVRHAFSYGAHQWLIDVDAPAPAPGWLRWVGSVRASDHLGPASGTLGANVRDFLAEAGVGWTAQRVLLLANARTLGYVFDPLSVYWCFAADGRLEGVVAEVHNTYGERHGYVLELDDRGRGHADKAFYVSPFFGVFGNYELRFTLDGDRVGAFITLRQHDEVVFTASFTGAAVPLTTRRVVTSAVRHPFMPQRVAALIRLHGVWLWTRRLPVVRRPQHEPQDSATPLAADGDRVGDQVVQTPLVAVVDDRRDDEADQHRAHDGPPGVETPAADPSYLDAGHELPGRGAQRDREHDDLDGEHGQGVPALGSLRW